MGERDLGLGGFACADAIVAAARAAAAVSACGCGGGTAVGAGAFAHVRASQPHAASGGKRAAPVLSAQGAAAGLGRGAMLAARKASTFVHSSTMFLVNAMPWPSLRSMCFS